MAASITSLPNSAAAATNQSSASSVMGLAPGAGRNALFSAIGLTTLMMFAYWQVFADTALEWSQPQYSHGWIIPLIALFIMWSRRPNGDPTGEAEAKLLEYARPAAGVLALAGGIGYTNGIGWLAGLSLAALCLIGLIICLLGQPFSSTGAKDESDGYQAETNYTGLWVFTGIGSALVLAGLTAMALDLRLPGPHPGYYQIAGLAVLGFGALGFASFSEIGSRAGAPEVVFGVTITVLSAAAWYFGTKVDMSPLIRFSSITTMVGIFTLVGGMRLLQWAGPSVGFLFFMFPLPTVLERPVLGLLQQIAVRGAEVVFTLIGTQVVRDGNTLDVAGIPMEVIEGCSGLSMSTILVAMAIAMALLMNRPWWDKLVVLVSSVPIAIMSNVFRIVATGLIWIVADMLVPMEPETAAEYRDMFHDVAGLVLMMPFALGLYWLEFKILSMLSVEEEGLEMQSAGVLGRGGAPPVAR